MVQVRWSHESRSSAFFRRLTELNDPPMPGQPRAMHSDCSSPLSKRGIVNEVRTKHAMQQHRTSDSVTLREKLMETIQLGSTDIVASRIGLGTWAMGGWMWGGSDEQQAIATIHNAIDRGITLIDTAPVYGFGQSEEIVGKALADGGRRARTLIATKVGLDWQGAKPFRNATRARIEKEAEDSLRRLHTDVIDLYQVHWPD